MWNCFWGRIYLLNLFTWNLFLDFFLKTPFGLSFWTLFLHFIFILSFWTFFGFFLDDINNFQSCFKSTSIGSNILAMKFEKHAMKIELEECDCKYIWTPIYMPCIQQLAFLSFFYSYLSLKGPWASVDIGILESYLKSIQQIFVERKRKKCWKSIQFKFFNTNIWSTMVLLLLFLYNTGMAADLKIWRSK